MAIQILTKYYLCVAFVNKNAAKLEKKTGKTLVGWIKSCTFAAQFCKFNQFNQFNVL